MIPEGEHPRGPNRREPAPSAASDGRIEQSCARTCFVWTSGGNLVSFSCFEEARLQTPRGGPFVWSGHSCPLALPLLFLITNRRICPQSSRPGVHPTERQNQEQHLRSKAADRSVRPTADSQRLHGVRHIVIGSVLQRAFPRGDGVAGLAATSHGHDTGAHHLQYTIGTQQLEQSVDLVFCAGDFEGQ
jgi:hypothetical protein